MALSKYRKLRYIPGSFSLVLLPIAFYFFTKYYTNQCLPGSIPLYVADSAFFEMYPLPNRNFTDIVFTGKPEEDNIKLQFAQIRIREIIVAGDTANGLHFFFTPNSNYETFIHTVDNLRSENAKYYLPYDNHLWFYHMVPEKPKVESLKIMECGYVIVEPRVSWWSKTRAELGHIWKSGWQLLLIYILFVAGIMGYSLRSRLGRRGE